MTVDIIIVGGTRPELIKLGPVAAELKARNVPYEFINTGQHVELLRGTPVETDLADGVSLGFKSDGDVNKYTHRLTEVLVGVFESKRPKVVVVQGDTMSAYAAAQATDGLESQLVHIEAGVRSHNLDEPWPEEMLRGEIDGISDWHCCATWDNVENLEREYISGEQVVLTGNPVVSALARYNDLETKVLLAQPLSILITLHRRELYNNREVVTQVCSDIIDAARRYPDIAFRWVKHPAFTYEVHNVRADLQNLLPLAYKDFVLMLRSSLGVLTDSGGVQEEAATLGIPCAVLRNVTDRPESVEAGVAAVYGFDVTRAVADLVEGKIARRATTIYGKVDSAANCATVVQRALAAANG